MLQAHQIKSSLPPDDQRVVSCQAYRTLVDSFATGADSTPIRRAEFILLLVGKASGVCGLHIRSFVDGKLARFEEVFFEKLITILDWVQVVEKFQA